MPPGAAANLGASPDGSKPLDNARASFASPATRVAQDEVFLNASTLAAVAQTGCDAVDRQVNPGNDILRRVTGAVALQQLDLHVVERIEIGKAVADRAGQERVALKQAPLSGDRQQCLDRRLPLR